MQFDAALQSFGLLHKQFGPLLDTGLLVFCRILPFVFFGPIFNRKNLPMLIKVSMALYLTTTLLWLIPVTHHGSFIYGHHGQFIIQMLVNLVIGSMLGFIANLVLQAIASAGNIMNNQIGLSSAMLLDPSTGTQTMVLEPLFGFIGVLAFIHMGGIQWMILALLKSFKMFPLYQVTHNLNNAIDLSYLIEMTGNCITTAVLFVAPIMVVTMAVDIILGIVNRAAQQMPVFQLSFALKPAIGVAIFLMTMPIFMQSITRYLNDHAALF